jgi:hypothetical protein
MAEVSAKPNFPSTRASRRWRPGRRAVLSAGLALAMTAAGAAAGTAGTATAGTVGPASPSGHLLSPLALGLNTAPWDHTYAANRSAGGGADVIQPLLKAAGISLLHYGGGAYADYYDWQTNTDIQTCIWGNPFGSFIGAPFPYDTTAPFTGASCDKTGALPFDQFASQAKAIGAQSFVTVNYGSGTPAEAAAWVSHAAGGVALWEVGNENYGCWEVNNWLAKAPENFQGYKPADGAIVNGHLQYPTCPRTSQGNTQGMQTLATSYAVNARSFMAAMKKADPAARIGVPWDFPSSVLGASVPDNTVWNDTVLGQDSQYISFVDAHYYPFVFRGATGGGNPSVQQVLQALMSVPSLYGQISAKLAASDPGAQVVIGETGVSNNATTIACTPTGALFAAGDVLSWLAAGAQSVDWWDMNNYSGTSAKCPKPDYGMFSSSSPPVAQTPYYGYLLASMLAQPNAVLATMGTSDPADVLAYQSRLPGGREALAFLNTSTSSAKTVTFSPGTPLSGQLRTWTYSAGNQNPANSNIVQGTVSASSAARGISLPPGSLVILQSS